MIRNEGKLNNLITLLVYFGGISVLCSIAACLCGVGIKNCLIFACYQICGIMLPGVAVSLHILRKSEKETDILSFFCFSYALGYGLQIVAYFLVAFSGFQPYSAQVIAALLFGSSVPVILSKRKRFQGFNRTETIWFVLFLLFLLLTFFAYSARYVLPGVYQNTAVYHADALYWIENAAALTKSFPPAELRMSGTILYYHYFASAYLAFANMITGIDVFSLGYALYPLGKTLILFGGLYSLSTVFSYDRKKQFFFLFILLLTTGLEKYSIVNYVAHILTLPFGFDISYGFGAYFLACMFSQTVDRKTSSRDCAFAAFFFLICAGHKAPVALVYLVFAGILCLFWLFGRQITKAFGNGLPILFCFLFVMIVCIGFMQSGESRVNAGGFSHVATLRASPLFRSYEPAALNREPGIKGILTVMLLYIKLMLLLVLSINPVLLLLTANGIICGLKNKTLDPVDWSLLGAMFFGVFMGMFNAQEGVSQMYYTLAVTIPAAFFGLRHLNPEVNRIQKSVSCIAVVFAVVQCVWFFCNSGAASAALQGFQTVTGTKSAKTEETVPYSIQKSDYEALCWLRENTDAHSVVLTDRSVLCDLDNYMYYGTFSERQMYLEGDRYFYGTYLEQREKRREVIREIYQNSTEAVEYALKDGVEFIVQTKWLVPDFKGTGCRLAFETDTIAVWQIEK